MTGSTSARHPSAPVTGTTGRKKLTSSIRPRPLTKVGTDVAIISAAETVPVTQRALPVVSTAERSASPIAAGAATPASAAVSASCSPITERTGTRRRYETPRSPCSRRPR